jgi:O-antigen ligase
LFALGVAAAAIAAVSGSRFRRHWWSVSVVLTLATVASLSRAAAVVAAIVLLVAVFVRTSSHRLRRWSAFAAPVLVAVLVAITVGMALGRNTLPEENGVEQALSTRRVALWHDATTLISQRPVFGVGPSRFDDTSPTALAYRDTRWAHSEYLQVAAEEGVPGVVLFAGLLCWVYGGLRRSRQNSRVVMIGIAAMTALAVQAGIDYVGHFPLVVVAAAAIAGLASGERSDRTASEASDGRLPLTHKDSTFGGACPRCGGGLVCVGGHSGRWPS